MSRHPEIDKARATLSRAAFPERERREDDAADGGSSPPVPPPVDRLTADRAWFAARDARWKAERAREARQEQRDRQQAAHPFEQRIDAIESSIGEHVTQVRKLAEAVDTKLAEQEITNAKLSAQVSQLEARLAKFELRAAEDRGRVVDLPALPRLQ
jgi:hypothetical protein